MFTLFPVRVLVFCSYFINFFLHVSLVFFSCVYTSYFNGLIKSEGMWVVPAQTSLRQLLYVIKDVLKTLYTEVAALKRIRFDLWEY